jgi:HK97 family phage major capsid protein
MKKFRSFGIFAVALAAFGAAASAIAGHPVTDLLSPGMLTALGALGGAPFLIGDTAVKTISEQIADLENTRAAKLAEANTLMGKSIAVGETTNEADAQAVDGLHADIGLIDKDLQRLKTQEKLMPKAPVDPTAGANPANAAAARGGSSTITTKDNRIVGKGLAVAQMAKCLYLSQGNTFGALTLAEQNKHLDPRVPLLLKAAVAAGTTASDAWAGALVGDETSAYADFVEFLRPATIIGRFGAGNVPSLMRVPFRTPLIGQTSGGAGYWVGEGNAKPVTKFDFARTTLLPLKVANIAVLTEEVLRDSSPAADGLVRDGLVAALRERLDLDFIDPAKTAVSDVSPASVTNGVAAVVSSGTDADAVRADVRAVFQKYIDANNAPTGGVWIMSATTALALSLMVNPLGQVEFPGISMNGGTFAGLPVLVTEYVPTVTAGSLVILVNASDVYMGDEGGFALDLSREASVQMDNAPDNPSSASTVMVSLWQRNLVGFRAERTINWKKRRPEAVQYISNVRWGA